MAWACYQAVLRAGNSGRGLTAPALDSLRFDYEVRKQAGPVVWAQRSGAGVFTGNATDSLNLALRDFLNPGDHVITTAMEHNSVLRPLYLLQEQGVELTILPADPQGRVDWSGLAQALKPNTRALVCAHGSNVTGNLNDLTALGQFCHEKGLAFLVDAAQTGRAVPPSIWRSSISRCSASPDIRASWAPQGIGALLVAPGWSCVPGRVGGTGVQSAPDHPAQGISHPDGGGHPEQHRHRRTGAALDWLEEQGRTPCAAGSRS